MMSVPVNHEIFRAVADLVAHPFVVWRDMVGAIWNEERLVVDKCYGILDMADEMRTR